MSTAPSLPRSGSRSDSRSRFRYRSGVVLGALSAALCVAACDHDLVEDATFRTWCGDQLCAWKLETGRVRPAPTWHRDDHGVELVDAPTAISQKLKRGAPCLLFTTIADVEPSAQVTVSIDFNEDGRDDYEQPIAAVAFRKVETQVTAPLRSGVPRITITKKGRGRAVLAQMSVHGASGCTAPPLPLRDRALGDLCSQDDPSACRSGVCCEGVCAECCVAPKFFDVGADAAVVTPRDVPCPNGGSCERRAAAQAAFLFTVVPLQCDPGKRLRPPGTACLADDDCASGVCEGTIERALIPSLDGAHEECEPDFPDAGGPSCLFSHVREGRCR